MKKEGKEVVKENYDLIIIGAGGTGLAAGMYASRLGLKTLVLGTPHGSELPIGGVITTTNVVENYPGFKKIGGMELARKIEEHARNYEDITIKTEKAESVEKMKTCFNIKTEKEGYKSKAIIFATGTKWRKLPKTVKGSEKFDRRGINYCALCDGPLYRGKTVAVIGGSDSAAIDALILAQYADKVYMIYRGEKIHPEPTNLEKIKENKKIKVINKTNVIEVKGSSKAESVTLDKPYKKKKELEVNAVFVAIGHKVLSGLAKDIGVKTNKKDEIIIDHKNCLTNVKGIFAAGDVTDKEFKQLIIGVADGCTAAYSAYQYITKEKIETCD
ncbi:FAD-dependent oxidoreductase [archaeon]|jgi:thioredoxin reductase (NADPH)|nr:FAD-dependent oxidoreductase [archaeon]MBT4373429.1 FAD-dependent oxidoreductase [archaeon]MBT4531877.1 FAD-dependent oxidoreductase [archaeon]MBT7001544.1 FAD-dependent oxidoreductase [archaeon]MBT7282564.1 FAD-dependent oxidoreductase [archaeon]